MNDQAIGAVKRGAGECVVRAVYAPNVAEPLDVQVEFGSGDARVRLERLVLRGWDGSIGGSAEMWPNAADIDIERGTPPD